MQKKIDIGINNVKTSFIYFVYFFLRRKGYMIQTLNALYRKCITPQQWKYAQHVLPKRSTKHVSNKTIQSSFPVFLLDNSSIRSALKSLNSGEKI